MQPKPIFVMQLKESHAMTDQAVFFDVSYGMYLVSAGDRAKGNGYIANTFTQVTAEPVRFATCCHKDNHTTGLILDSGVFSVSVLQRDTPGEVFTRFGYKSGKEMNKLEGMRLRYGETGVPIVLDHAVSFLECRVLQTLDLGTHYLFIADVIHAEKLDRVREPMTYAHYRQVKKGLAPKNAPTYINPATLAPSEETTKHRRFQCTQCGYFYDEAVGDPLSDVPPGTRFDDLQEDWVCPLCGAEKEYFVEE